MLLSGITITFLKEFGIGIWLMGLTLTDILIALAVHAGTVALAARDAAGKANGLSGLR